MPPGTPAAALIGRESEMALLTGLIKEVAKGRGSSALIEGEPGIGKSALVRAAVAQAPEAGCQVFWGAGDELGQALPLLPFLDGLRVREPSANPRREAIVRLLRGEIAADRGTDVPAILAEQLLALVAEQCAARQREDLLALRRVPGGAARLKLTGLTGAAVADLVAALAGGRPDGSLLR